MAWGLVQVTADSSVLLRGGVELRQLAGVMSSMYLDNSGSSTTPSPSSYFLEFGWPTSIGKVATQTMPF